MEPENKYSIFTEARGLYTIVKEKRMWQLTFPIDVKIEDNIETAEEILRALKEALQKATEKEEAKSL